MPLCYCQVALYINMYDIQSTFKEVVSIDLRRINTMYGSS